MAKNKRSAEDDFQDDAELEGMEDGDEEEGVDFFTTELERYEALLESDPDTAVARYGFTLFHSLPPLKQVALAEKLGLPGGSAPSHFNSAGVKIAAEDYAGAIKLLQQALEQDGTHADAAYNLALCLEKSGKKQEAVNAWARVQELTQDEESRREIERHLAELKA